MRTEPSRRAARPYAPSSAGTAARAPAPARERARRRLVRLVLAIYLMAIFEGALRKYVFPQFGQFIFFIRDPFVLWAYLLATRWQLWPRRDAMFRLACGFVVGGVLLLILQNAFAPPSDLRLLLGVYGWRAYFYYVPLAFLVGAQFRRDDLLRLARLTLLLAVPIAVLVAAQFFSPPGAAVNVGTSENQALQFRDLTVDVTHIRAAGTFSSNVGQQQFVTTAFAMLLALLMMPATQRHFGALGMLAATGAILTCIALGGSRGTTLQCVMILLFSLPIAMLGRGTALRTRALLLPTALAIVAVLLYPVIFPEGFAVFVQRWQTAAVDERGFQGGVFGRALFGFVDFLRLVDTVPPLGYGLGFGGNASNLLQATVDGVRPGLLAETDYARHMVDMGPVCGLFYIGFRVALVAALLSRVVRATRRSGDPLPMMLFGYAGYVTLLSQITGNGSINVYGWLFTGLCLAACRVAAPATAWSPVRVPALARPRARREFAR
jgi:hypothetical protein